MRKLIIILLFAFANILCKAQGFEAAQKHKEVDSLIIKIQTILRQTTFYCCPVEDRGRIGITEKIDITGDSIPEVLVSLACGGAYTDCYTLMRMENGEPIVALFKGKDGKVSPSCFCDGASVKNKIIFKMLPSKNAIYGASWSWDEDDNSIKATLEAFQWNGQTKTFDYNRELSNELLSEIIEFNY